MKRQPSFMRSMLRYVAHTLISIAVIVIGGIVSLLLAEYGKKTGRDGFILLGFATLLIGLFLGVFFTKNMFWRMREDETLSLTHSAAHTFYYYLLLLEFIPFIGPLLRRFVDARKKPNPFLEAHREE